MLEELKQEMLDAKEAYQTFLNKNSTVVSDKEQDSEVIQREFKLTKENVEEFKRLNSERERTQMEYLTKYKEVCQNR